MPMNEYYFHAAPNSLDPILCGNQNCSANHSWGPAVRIYWLIHYVVSGKGIFRIGGKEYAVNAGSFFVIPPYEEVSYTADADDPWTYIWIGFHCGSHLPVIPEPVTHCPDAYEIFHSISECTQMAGGKKAYLTARLWDLFALLLEQKNPPDDCVSQALSFIHTKYMNPISVEQIASQVNLERSYFTTLFTKRTGVPPGKYLQNYRMEIAANLLAQGHKSVSLTAQSVGYSDIYTFSKTFKRHFGLPPRNYAKQH